MQLKDINAIIILFIVLLGTSSLLFGQKPGQNPDIMAMEAFKKQVLEPKEEFWVVDFWASWCGPCIAAMPEVKAAQRRFEKENVRFFSVSWDKDQKRWLAALDHFNMPWTQILIPDVTQTSFLDLHFKHKSIPTLFLVYPDGKVKKVRDSDHLTQILVKKLPDQD